MIAIVTAWRDTPELIPDYEECVGGAHVVAVDNGTDPKPLREMCERLGGTYVKGDPSLGFAAANNLGMDCVRENVVACLNSDVRGDQSWLADADVIDRPGIYGPSILATGQCGGLVLYLSGHCIAATRDTWDRLGRWDAIRFPVCYYEDVALSLTAQYLKLPMYQTQWRIEHIGKHTSKKFPEAFAHEGNRDACRGYHEELKAKGFKVTNKIIQL